MLQFTKLCVKLQRSQFAKDGLYQYRNICKEVAPNSFEKVVNHFLSLAEDKAGKARQESEATVLQEIDDLDVVMTPERCVYVITIMGIKNQVVEPVSFIFVLVY